MNRPLLDDEDPTLEMERPPVPRAPWRPPMAIRFLVMAAALAVPFVGPAHVVVPLFGLGTGVYAGLALLAVVAALLAWRIVWFDWLGE